MLTNRDFGRNWWRAKVQGESCGKNDNPTLGGEWTVCTISSNNHQLPAIPLVIVCRIYCCLSANYSLPVIHHRNGPLEHCTKDVVKQNVQNRRRVGRLGLLMYIGDVSLTNNFAGYGS